MKTIDKGFVNDTSSDKKKDEDYLVEHPEGTEWLSNSKKEDVVKKIIKIKKEREAHNNKRKVLHLSIGFCISLLLIISAFEWKSYESNSQVAFTREANDFDDLMEVPPSEQPPPPPPKVENPQIVEVDDEEVIEQEIEIDLDIEVTEDSKIEETIFEIPNDEPIEEKAEEIFTIVEQQPTPEGGFQAFYKFVGENLDYPNMATRMSIQGKVFVQFVVEKDGSLTDIQVVKGIGAGCDDEAIRVLKLAPNWNPGKQRGRPVRVRMILPITFKLVE